MKFFMFFFFLLAIFSFVYSSPRRHSKQRYSDYNDNQDQMMYQVNDEQQQQQYQSQQQDQQHQGKQQKQQLKKHSQSNESDERDVQQLKPYPAKYGNEQNGGLMSQNSQEENRRQGKHHGKDNKGHYKNDSRSYEQKNVRGKMTDSRENNIYRNAQNNAGWMQQQDALRRQSSVQSRQGYKYVNSKEEQ